MWFLYCTKPDKSLLIGAIPQNCSEMLNERLQNRLQHHEAGLQSHPVLTPLFSPLMIAVVYLECSPLSQFPLNPELDLEARH